MRWLIGFVLVLAIFGVVLGFGGQIHPAGDSLALFRPIFGMVCLAGLFVTWSRWIRWSTAAATVAVMVSIIPAFLGQSAQDDVRLYAKNLWWANSQIVDVVADIRAADVDVVMLQEVSERNREVLEMLAPDFPHQHLCRYSQWSQLAVLSRTPFAGEPVCSASRAVAAAPVMIEGQRIWAVSLHIPWPWPYQSADNEAQAEEILATLDAPVVVAGDFNSFPWTSRVRQIARHSDTQLAGPTRPTLTLWNMPIPIDHVLAPGGGHVERRPLFGSDHRGLVANVSLKNGTGFGG